MSCRRASSLETTNVIKAWEGSAFRTVWGEAEMRACGHQILCPGHIAEILEPERIPEDLRFFGPEFPQPGPATRVVKADITVSPRETGNRRCA